MPTIQTNKSAWDGEYDWPEKGDEWSAAWGGPHMQWFGTIYPRIASHLPASDILEIACGYGRWTNYLKDLCDHLVLVDLSEECIQACKQRFGALNHIEYHVNDGKSLDFIADASVDFVFSFDSLVHADEAVMQSYLAQIQRILKPEGVAFLHHSNAAQYSSRYHRISRVPGLKWLLETFGIMDKKLHWRDMSVDAERMAQWAEKNGLKCISQEVVHWGTKRMLIDCMSTIIASESGKSRDNRVFLNHSFMLEAESLRLKSDLYDPQ